MDPGFKGECRSRAIVKGEFSRLNLNFTALPDCDTFVVQNSPLFRRCYKFQNGDAYL